MWEEMVNNFRFFFFHRALVNTINYYSKLFRSTTVVTPIFLNKIDEMIERYLILFGDTLIGKREEKKRKITTMKRNSIAICLIKDHKVVSLEHFWGNETKEGFFTQIKTLATISKWRKFSALIALFPIR